MFQQVFQHYSIKVRDPLPKLMTALSQPFLYSSKRSREVPHICPCSNSKPACPQDCRGNRILHHRRHPVFPLLISELLVILLVSPPPILGLLAIPLASQAPISDLLVSLLVSPLPISGPLRPLQAFLHCLQKHLVHQRECQVFLGGNRPLYLPTQLRRHTFRQ